MDGQEKKMTFLDVTLMSAGNIIGAGIFTLTGVAVGASGPGLPLSFLLAGLLCISLCLPYMVLGSAIPTKGGPYMYVSRFIHPAFGFLQVWNFLMQSVMISVLGISAGQYLPSIFPMLTPKIASVICILFMMTACLFNVKSSAIVQNTMVILMLVALAFFVGMGVPQIKYWSPGDVFAVKGLSGVLLAVSYLKSAAWGGANVVNLGAEIENPGKTLPRAIGTATVGVSIVYALVAVVAIGVVPWEQMVGQPLSVPAKAFMPAWAFNFFVIGGALFAVLTTMLSQFLSYSRAIWAATSDGMFPEALGKLNKYGIPYRIVMLMACIALTPVLMGWPVKFVFAVMAAPAMLINIIVTLPALIAPKVLPEKFESAYFKLSTKQMWAVITFNVVSTLYLSYNLFLTLSAPTIIGIVVFYGSGIAYYFLRIKYLASNGIDLVSQMKVMEPSWVN